MSATLTTEEAKAKVRGARKKRVAVWNRRLAWVTFPTLVVGSLLYYTAAGGWIPNGIWLGMILVNALFTPLFLIHAAFSVYLFGFPKLRRHIRVAHIYIGYAVFACILTSQTLIGLELYHKIAFALNWVFILAHVTLSTRFMLQRQGRGRRVPELAHYTGGPLRRDAATE